MGRGGRPGPLSPRRVAGLVGREGSEGGASMGSSFSDLDGGYFVLSSPPVLFLVVDFSGCWCVERMIWVLKALMRAYANDQRRCLDITVGVRGTAGQ